VRSLESRFLVGGRRRRYEYVSWRCPKSSSGDPCELWKDSGCRERTYADLFVLGSSGEIFTIGTEADTPDVKVARFSGGFIYKYAEIHEIN
jgi:hypothetical protein